MVEKRDCTQVWAAMLLKNDRYYPIKQRAGIRWSLTISLRFSCSMRVNSLGTLQSGLAMPILTSTHMSVPLGSGMWMSAVWTARASRAASWLSLGRGVACSDVAMAPVVLTYSTKESLNLLCRTSLARLAHQATCRPMVSRCLARLLGARKLLAT